MTPENVRGLQCQISDAVRDRASRIRNGNDLATVRKVLGEVRESAAQWLRQTGGDPSAHGWIKTTDRLPTPSDHPGGATRRDSWGRVVPIDHIPCLVVLRSRPKEVALLLWNPHEPCCWDDASGDDFYCGAGDVLHWMPAPAVPAEEVPDGE